MSQIPVLQFNDINSISVSFVDENTCSGNAKIKINNCTYNVFVYHNSVEVNREASLLKNLFTKDQSNAISEIIRGKIQQINQNLQLRYAEESRIKHTLITNLKEHAQSSIDSYINKHSSSHPVFAMYGFSGVRQAALVGAAANTKRNAPDNSPARNLQVTCVDNHNSAIGLVEESVTAAKLPGCIRDLKTGRNDTLREKEEKSPNMYIDKDGWRAFLARHVDKIDIFSRILDIYHAEDEKSDVELSGWKKESRDRGAGAAIEAFIRKNLSFDAASLSDSDIKALTAALILYAQSLEIASEHVLPEEEFTAVCNSLLNNDLKDALDSVIRTAFFRQTSKLALDFFKEKGIPVLFAWTDYRGYTIQGEQNEKWWKGEKKFSPSGAPITYSEMRYVQRQEDAAGIPYVTRVQGTDRPQGSSVI